MDLGFEANYFNPQQSGGVVDEKQKIVTVAAASATGRSYTYDTNIVLAVNLALATRRPLFVAGKPGTGKTTLARNVAQILDARYYEKVVTSRTRAKDLMWTFDALRRLSDAQALKQGEKLPPRSAYLKTEVLWRAFDPAGARRFDSKEADAQPRAVVLIDEIDKADPDVPNDLLEVLDLAQFTVDELDEPLIVKDDTKSILIIITSNGERELPPAFLRRCVVLYLADPNEDWLVTVANSRYGKEDPVHRHVAKQVMALRVTAKERDQREPSTAEYLDAVAACKELDIAPQSEAWKLLEDALLRKLDPEQTRS